MTIHRLFFANFVRISSNQAILMLKSTCPPRREQARYYHYMAGITIKRWSLFVQQAQGFFVGAVTSGKLLFDMS